MVHNQFMVGGTLGLCLILLYSSIGDIINALKPLIIKDEFINNWRQLQLKKAVVWGGAFSHERMYRILIFFFFFFNSAYHILLNTILLLIFRLES